MYSCSGGAFYSVKWEKNSGAIIIVSTSTLIVSIFMIVIVWKSLVLLGQESD
jgi:hypothetical protein